MSLGKFLIVLVLGSTGCASLDLDAKLHAEIGGRRAELRRNDRGYDRSRGNVGHIGASVHIVQ